MPDDIEVTVNETQNDSQNANQKDEVPVTIQESDGDTLVTVGERERPSEKEDTRWRNAEQDNLRLRADFADLRATIAGSGVARSAPAASPDPWKAQEDAISERERALGIQWEAHKAARSLTPELLKDFDQKSRELNQERMNISTQRAVANIMPQFLQASQEQAYARQYADVRGNPAANRWARGHYDQLVAQGAPEGDQTVARAMNAARIQFRLGTAPAPSDHERQQYTGFGGNMRRGTEPKSNVVKMGKAEKGMAMAMYGDRHNGDEKKAYAQWAKGPGIRAQRAAQKARRQSA